MVRRFVPKFLRDRSGFRRRYFIRSIPKAITIRTATGSATCLVSLRSLIISHSIGCNAIWLNPIFESPFGDAGYDVADFYRVAARYGTNDDFKHLCAEVHKRGMHVCVDLVAGHSSIANSWFQQSALDWRNRYSNWYIWTPAAENVTGSQPYPGQDRRPERYLPNFFPFQPALNYGYARPDPKEPWQLPTSDPACIAVREELKKVMKYWLELGADGFRVDMAASLIRNDPDHQGISALWHYYRSWLDKEYPEAALISEWSDPAVAIPAGFHVDSFLQFGKPYQILLGPEARLNGDAREPHCLLRASRWWRHQSFRRRIPPALPDSEISWLHFNPDGQSRYAASDLGTERSRGSHYFCHATHDARRALYLLWR